MEASRIHRLRDGETVYSEDGTVYQGTRWYGVTRQWDDQNGGWHLIVGGQVECTGSWPTAEEIKVAMKNEAIN